MLIYQRETRKDKNHHLQYVIGGGGGIAPLDIMLNNEIMQQNRQRKFGLSYALKHS